MNKNGNERKPSISAIVCCWNSIKTIGKCLRSLRNNNVDELIVVDADSTDGTRDVAIKYADKVLSDPREGLARARNIGIESATKEYIINVGADNVMPNGSIKKMLQYLIQNGYTGVSAMTLLDAKGNYFSWAMNAYKKARFFPGQRDVIGTPTLFPAVVLKQNPYDNKMSWSDDGDLCDRLRKKGHKFAIANAYAVEIGSEDLGSIFYRWKGYGKSDWEIYAKYSPTWNIPRKWKSLTHPLRNEFIYPLARTVGHARVKIFTFLLLITTIRYYSWLKHYLRH